MEKLFKNKPFWALFGTQFLGAYNDNFFRTSFVTLITYHLATYQETVKSLFISAAFGLFMLPFFMFSPLAGQLADGYDKSKIIRVVKGAEVLIVSLSAYGFIHTNPYFLLAALFFMGAHSAFFGPAKYSILPEILTKERLLIGNGYIEAGTFLAILLGTLCGALLIHLEVSLVVVSLLLLIVALAGFCASWLIPSLPVRAPKLKLRLSWFTEMKSLYRYARNDRRVYKAIVAIAWFWLVGALLMAQLPPFAKGILHVEESVFIFLLLLFTIGIGLGSLFCNVIFKGEVTTKHAPILALLMVPLLFDISSFRAPFADTLTSLTTFLFSFQGLRLTFDILGLSFVGGLYIVPLYAFIQTHVSPSQRSQVIAFNNIMNAGFMVFISFASFCLLSIGLSIPTLIFLTAVGQIVLTVYVIRILPEPLFKQALYGCLRVLFRLEVKGLENYQKGGKRVILIANHMSYIDALLLAAVLPEKPLFAINSFTAQRWWVRPFLVLAKVFPIDPFTPYALREVIEEAKQGHKVLIFPEGRLTLTGSLMKIYEGPGMVAEKANARILPIRIEGAQYTFFSHLKGQVPRHFFPKITITILPSQKLSVDSTLKGRARRRALSEHLYDLMVKMLFITSPLEKTLFSALIESQKRFGAFTPILEDASRKVLTYGALMVKVFALSRLLARKTNPGEAVGLMLPNSHGLVVSFWALQASGRTAALLNYTSGAKALLTSCQLAGIRHVFTSRLLIEKARLQNEIESFRQDKIHIHYLEDMIKKIRLTDKIWGLYGRFFPTAAYERRVPLPNPADRSVILFTSGSEATPKGVVLTHLNLQANRYQMMSVVDFNSKDRILNVLPLFHAFGLSVGMILPLLSGIRAFHYVSPLHYRVVAELVYDMGATILFGTDTFLSGYGRVAHAYDFHTLRYVFAGAEKLKEETEQLWFTKFGLRLFEGYGATETGPVLAVNTPMRYRARTVGKLLPGISYRLDALEGIAQGGQLWVQGPNVMEGYLAESSKITPLKEGWYDTGDIVNIDGEGYVHILGRVKRFAKVGGEMISLTSIEEAVTQLWPEHRHAVITRPDPKKGEQVVLFTDYSLAERSALLFFWRAQGLSELSLPKVVQVLPSLPLLGSGKVNYRALGEEGV